MAISDFRRFPHGHKDLILATAHSSDGTRMATASSDHTVKVWTREPTTAAAAAHWTLTDHWPAHSAEITGLVWFPPHAGAHLATIGEDGLLNLWREDGTQPLRSGRRFRAVFHQHTETGVPYMSIDVRGPSGSDATVLAAITRDGYLSVSEPEGDPDDFSAWRVLWADYLCPPPPRTEETGFRLSFHHEPVPAWPAVLAGLDRKSIGLAVAMGDAVKVFRTDAERRFYTAAVLERKGGGGRSGALVRDVAWSNGSMRGFDTIATASKDGFVSIYELHTPGAASLPTVASTAATSSSSSSSHPPSSYSALSPPSAGHPARSGIGAGLAGASRGQREENGSAPGAVKADVKLVAELEAKRGTPWRVSWSFEGDLLVATSDEGAAGVWRKGTDGRWVEVAEVDATREG